MEGKDQSKNQDEVKGGTEPGPGEDHPGLFLDA